MKLHIALAALALAPASALAFQKGPYLQAVTETSAALVWQASTEAPGRVQVTGPDGFRAEVTSAKPTRAGMVEVRIDGLTAGTTYRYTVEEPGKQAGGRLTTQPRRGQPFDFVIYGDNRSDHRAHQAVIELIMAQDPDFLVSTGDLVGHGGREFDWRMFFALSRAMLADVPLYPVLGNHDTYGDGGSLFQQYFLLPGNEQYYAFTWGNIRFIAIDGEVNVEDGHGPDATQRAWLLQETRAAAKDPAIDHIIGFVHRGPYSSNPRRTGNKGLRDFLPSLYEAGMTLIASGHDHFYERGVGKLGMPYMVVGGGGAPLYETKGPGDHGDYVAFVSRSVHSFVRLRSSGGLLSGCAVDLTGAAFDCFEYPSRRKVRVPEPVLRTP